MPTRRGLVVALSGLAAIAGACGSDDGAGGSLTGASAAPSEVTVDISDFAFTDAEVAVAPGATIAFVNADSTAHTATARDGEFNTGSIPAEGSASVTVGDAGTVAYFCSLHPFMEGEVVIR